MTLQRGRDGPSPAATAPRPGDRDFQAQGVHKLDSAMSVLTTLLVDLEHELRDHSTTVAEIENVRPELPAPRPAAQREDRKRGGNAPRDVAPLSGSSPAHASGGALGSSQELNPPGSSTPGYSTSAVNARADKLDSALSVLTRQLAELERELRGHSTQGGDLGPPAGCSAVGARQGGGAAELPGSKRASLVGSGDCSVEAELGAMQEKVSALMRESLSQSGLGANPQEDCPPARGWLAPGFDEVDGQPPPETLSPSGSSRAATPTAGTQVVLPPPAASPALSACSIASLAKVQMEGQERAGSAALAGSAPQPARAPAARRGSMSPQPVGVAQRSPLSAPGTTGSIGGVAARRGPQTPIRGARDARPAASSSGLSGSVELHGAGAGASGAAASGGSWAGRGRRASCQEEGGGAEAAHPHTHSFQGSATPLHSAGTGARGTSAVIPASSPKNQYAMHGAQASHSYAPRLSMHEAQRAASPVQAVSKTSPRQNYYPMSRSATPQGLAPQQGGLTPRAAAAAHAVAQRSQSPQRRRQPAPGASSPSYPHSHGSAAIPLRLNSAPHGSATPTVGTGSWQHMSHSPMRNSVTRGSASIPAASNAPPPAVMPPPPASEPALDRVPSRSISQMDLSAPAVPPPNSGLVSASPQGSGCLAPGSNPNLGSVPPPTTGPSPPVPGMVAGASVAVGGPLVPGKSFAATSQAGMASMTAPVNFGMLGQPPGAMPAAPKAPGPQVAAPPAPLTGSPQHASAGANARTLQARSPSRTRSVNPNVVQHNMYSSPFAMRKQDPVVNMFSPQVPAPPPVFAMQRCNTSMTSSNASFYFNPQHAMMGPGAQNPVPASHYVADSSDPIDLMLSVGLSSLDRCTSSKLVLRRLAMGKYDIDGRRVSLKWTDQGGQPGLLVCEDEVADKGSEMPLLAYLSQAANVAASLRGGRADMPKIARVPKEQRLTFAEEAAESASTLDVDKVGNERCESMRIACEQARLREQAAEAYEHGMYGQHPPRSLPPPPGLPMPYLN